MLMREKIKLFTPEILAYFAPNMTRAGIPRFMNETYNNVWLTLKEKQAKVKILYDVIAAARERSEVYSDLETATIGGENLVKLFIESKDIAYLKKTKAGYSYQ